MKRNPFWLALAAAALAGCGTNDAGLGLEAFVCTDDGTYTVEEGTGEGHTVIHRGKCGDPMTCDSVIDCFGGDECRTMDGESPPYPGDVCVPIPWYCPCPGVLAPVCGADGQTYINACEARCVGVRVVHRGRCKDDPKPDRCRTDEDCEPGEHCEYPGPIPLSVDPEAPCIEGEPCPPFGHGICVPDVAFCYDDDDCPVGEICEHVLLRPTPPDGVCFPCACPEIYQPVCGVDGQTYGNRCEARCAHVEVAHEGQCEPCPVTHVKTPDGRCEPKCYGDEQCPRWTVCNAPWVCLQDPACPECDVCVGWCEGCVCPAIYDPVCGVDGETYGNACEARCARVEIAHEGPCEPYCADDDQCPVGQICNEGLLAPPPYSGICEPCACLDIYQPVCGVDGQTYGNGCEARCAHVEVAHEGPCERPDCRITGCPEKHSCQQCFVDWVCIPDGVFC